MDLDAQDGAVCARAEAWRENGVQWRIRRGPATPKPAANLSVERASAMADLTLWMSGEAELGWSPDADTEPAWRHYEISSALELNACLDDLQAHLGLLSRLIRSRWPFALHDCCLCRVPCSPGSGRERTWRGRKTRPRSSRRLPSRSGQPARSAQGEGAPVQGAVRLPGAERPAPGEDRAADGRGRDRGAADPQGRGTRRLAGHVDAGGSSRSRGQSGPGADSGVVRAHGLGADGHRAGGRDALRLAAVPGGVGYNEEQEAAGFGIRWAREAPRDR